jgi:DNA polymerase
MRHALNALADELRRLKDDGVKSVAVSEASLAALRVAAKRRGQDADIDVGPAQSGVEGPPDINIRVLTPSPRAAAPGPALPPPPVVDLPAGDKAARWAALRERVLGDPVCRAHTRPGKQVVLGVGHLDARIMFVGEAPGAEEEVQGEPFVGPAGQLLNRMIAGMGLTRGEVYIGNIMNWRPEMPLGPGGVQVGNRPPTAGEMAYCLPYLRAQIDVVDPGLLVALGATAAQGLLGPGAFKALGEIRGQWREFQGKPLMITYHPSYILRNPTNRSKRLIWEDFLKVMERAGLPVSAKQRGYFLDR